MKIFLETPALRFVTKKFADAISDLDAKIADSPVLAPLFGVEKNRSLQHHLQSKTLNQKIFGHFFIKT